MDQQQAMQSTPNQELAAFIKRNRQFIKIKDGESLTAVYRGMKTSLEMSFGKEKEVISYMIEEVGTGRIVPWKTSSLRVAADMQAFSIGETITITRAGAGPNDTKYTITAVGAEAPAVAAKKK